MNTVISLLTNMVSKSAFFALFIALTLSLGCQQAEEQSADETTETTTEEVTSDEQKDEGDGMDSKDQASEEPSGDTTESKTGDDEVVATVNGNPIYESDLKNQDLDTAIRNEIFYIDGINRGYDERFAKQFDNYKKRMISSTVRKEYFNQVPKQQATEEEMKEYYKDNEIKYTHLAVNQLTLQDEDTAEEVREKAAGGTPFEDIIAEYKEKGVSISSKEYRLPTHYNGFFDKLEVGSVSDVQKNQNGFQVLKIKQVQKIPFEKAKPAIRHAVIALKRDKVMDEFAEKIKEENNIEVKILKD